MLRYVACLNKSYLCNSNTNYLRQVICEDLSINNINIMIYHISNKY